MFKFIAFVICAIISAEAAKEAAGRKISVFLAVYFGLLAIGIATGVVFFKSW